MYSHRREAGAKEEMRVDEAERKRYTYLATTAVEGTGRAES